MSVFDDEDDDETSGGPLVTNSPVLTSSDEKSVAPPPVKGADNSSAASPSEGDESDYLMSPAASAPQEEEAPVDPDYGVAAPPPLPQSQPLTPLPDHSQDEAAWATQKASESPAAYKPSGWRRALAAVAGSMAGIKNPEAGYRVAQGVVDAPQQRVQAEWAQQEAPIQARMQADQQADQRIRDNNAATSQQNAENDRQFRNQVYEQGATARAQNFAAQAAAKRNAIVNFTPDNPDNPYDGGTGVTADGRKVTGVQPPDSWIKTWTRSTEGQRAMQKMTLAQRQTTADQIGLKGQDRTDFLANGKIPAKAPNTNIRIPSAQSQEYEDWKAAFVRENKRQPTPGEIESFARRGGAAGGGDPESQAGAIATKFMNAKENELAKYVKNPDGSWTNQISGLKLSPAQYKNVIDGFRIRANADPTMRKLGYQVDERGNLGKIGEAPAQNTAPAAAQPRPVVHAPSGKTVAIGAIVNVNGQPRIVTGFNPKTGKVLVGPVPQATGAH